MIEIRDEISVPASAAEVWRAIQSPEVHARWHPFVTRIDGTHDLGAYRRCHVRIGRTEGTTQEYVSDLEPGNRIVWKITMDSTGFSRMVDDWSAGFVLTRRDGETTLVAAVSNFRPRGLMVRLMLPMIRWKFHQTQRAILRGLVAFLSSGSSS